MYLVSHFSADVHIIRYFVPDQPEAANEGSKNITHNYSPQFDKRLSLSLSLSLKLLIVEI